MTLQIIPRTIRSGDVIPGQITFSGPVPADQDVKKRFDGLLDDYKKKILSTQELVEFREVQKRRAAAEAELAQAKQRIESLKNQIERAAISGDDDAKIQKELASTIGSLVGLESRLKGVESILAEKRNQSYMACLQAAKKYGPSIEKEIKATQKAALQKANESLVDVLQAHLSRIDTVSSYGNYELSSAGGCEKYLAGIGVRTNS